MSTERILQILEASGLTQKEFSERVGISASMLSLVKSGDNKVSARLLEGVACAFPEVNRDWLLTGEGEMYGAKRVNAPIRVASEDGSISYQIDISKDMIPVPYYEDVFASAGGGFVPDAVHVVPIFLNGEFVADMYGSRPNDLFMLPMIGDSMEPVLRSKENLLVESYKEEQKISIDGIYVIRIDGDLMVKRIQKLPGGTVKVISENKSYETYTISPRDESVDFVVVGRVIYIFRRI